MRTWVLDTSALLAFLDGKPGAARVRDCLYDARRGHSAVFMSAVNYGEAFSVLHRLYGRDSAVSTLAAIHQLPLNIEDATKLRAIAAADIKVHHKLHYSDAFAAALALERKATLVTSDSDFRRLGHSFPILWLKP